MKIPIESSKKKSEYSINIYGALDVGVFPNKRLNVDLKNIEIMVSHGFTVNLYTWMSNGIAGFWNFFGTFGKNQLPSGIPTNQGILARNML